MHNVSQWPNLRHVYLSTYRFSLIELELYRILLHACVTDRDASCFHLPRNDFFKDPPSRSSDAGNGNSSVVACTTKNGG